MYSQFDCDIVMVAITVLFLNRYFSDCSLCQSHSNTIKLVGILGEDFDLPVKEWKSRSAAQV